MGDLLERLRSTWAWSHDRLVNPNGPEAADRIEALETALRPFAKWADWHDGAKGTDVERCFSKAEITVGELRAARKALEGGK